jgi:hypothetical protein
MLFLPDVAPVPGLSQIVALGLKIGDGLLGRQGLVADILTCNRRPDSPATRAMKASLASDRSGPWCPGRDQAGQAAWKSSGTAPVAGTRRGAGAPEQERIDQRLPVGQLLGHGHVHGVLALLRRGRRAAFMDREAAAWRGAASGGETSAPRPGPDPVRGRACPGTAYGAAPRRPAARAGRTVPITDISTSSPSGTSLTKFSARAAKSSSSPGG